MNRLHVINAPCLNCGELASNHTASKCMFQPTHYERVPLDSMVAPGSHWGDLMQKGQVLTVEFLEVVPLGLRVRYRDTDSRGRCSRWFTATISPYRKLSEWAWRG